MSKQLHRAIRERREAEVLALVRRGVNIQARDRQGMTPLHLAIDRQMTETVQALLEAGAPVNNRNAQGWTPLEFACAKGTWAHIRICDLLRAHGAEAVEKDSGSDRLSTSEIAQLFGMAHRIERRFELPDLSARIQEPSLPQALEDALLDADDDDSVWALYGDWLLEQGDSRGELLCFDNVAARSTELSVQLLKRRDAPIKALAAQIDSLVEPGRWPSGGLMELLELKWKGPFIRQIKLTEYSEYREAGPRIRYAVLIVLLLSLPQAHWLRRVEFEGTQDISDGPWSWTPERPALRKVKVKWGAIVGARRTVGPFDFAPNLKQLEVDLDPRARNLSLDFLGEQVRRVLVSGGEIALEKLMLPKLKRLEICGTNLREDTLQWMLERNWRKRTKVKFTLSDEPMMGLLEEKFGL